MPCEVVNVICYQGLHFDSPNLQDSFNLALFCGIHEKYAMWKFIVDVVHDFVSSLQPDVGRGFLHVSNVFLFNQGSTLSPWQHVPGGHVVSKFYVPWQNFYVPDKITNYFPSHNFALMIEWAIFGEMSKHLRSVVWTCFDNVFDRLGMNTQ